MRTKGRSAWVLWAGLGLAALSGCQTWVPEAGMTLPTGHYLQHFPTYIPPSPPFPLLRETASLEEAAAQQAANPPRPAIGPGMVGP
jgi:hypothetical protein